MQFKYLGEPNGSDNTKRILDQFEVWSLRALVDVARRDMDEAARLFGSSPETLISRFEKHGMLDEVRGDQA